MRQLFVLFVMGISTVSQFAFADDPMLPPVEVTASAIGGSVTLPIWILPRVSTYSPTHMSMLPIEGQRIDLTKAQVCKMLKDNKPAGCSTSIYPPAPGVPSSAGIDWAGNGCGAGSTDPFNNLLISEFYEFLNDNYSGNLNAPIKGRSDIDFTKVCNLHDGCYTSSRSKSACDNAFARNLTALCGAVGDAAGEGDCNTASAEYELAVSKKGDAAYSEDQGQYDCATWGDSMKKDGCGSM